MVATQRMAASSGARCPHVDSDDVARGFPDDLARRRRAGTEFLAFEATAVKEEVVLNSSQRGAVASVPLRFRDPYLKNALITTGIFIIGAMSFDLLLGLTGRLSPGHIALSGIADLGLIRTFQRTSVFPNDTVTTVRWSGCRDR